MWILYSLSAALFAALVIILSKLGIQKLDPIVVFGIESVCMVIISWSIIFSKKLSFQIFNVERKIWVFILTAGVLTTLSSLASFHSLKLGQASRTSSFEKISLVFSVILSILILKEKLNWQIVIGAILMAAGCLFIAFSDTSKS